MQNDKIQERKPSVATVFKLLFQYCFGFLFFFFSFNAVKFRNPVAFFKKKGETVEIILYFQNTKEKSFVDFQLSYRIEFQVLPKFSLL